MAKRRRQKPSVHKKSLEQQIEDPAAFGVRAQERSRNKKRNRAEEGESELVSAGISARILKEARAQQQEVDAEEYEEQQQQEGTIPRGMLAAALQNLQDSDDEGEEEGDAPWSDTESLYDAHDVEVSPDDEKALAAFMAPNADAYQQRSLADLIAEKMQEQQQLAGQAAADEGVAGLGAGPLDERVVEVYRGVGKLLSRYTVGKVPKAFKIIPNLRNWEEVLAITEPHNWTPHAVYQATRIFVSNMNSRLAQRFLALVLLPRVRDEIRTHQRLHFVLFQAMRKSTYKPAAFFKGLLLPLAASRTCTLREAVIFTSCLKRSSLPVLHSAAALLRLAELEYCGTTSFFMRVLLDKKYALPIRVLAALTRHFLRFQDDDRQMPVVWHQTLLCFVQRYKNELTAADRDALRTLCTHQKHYQVTPEVLRELDHGVPRDQRGAGGVEAMQVQHAAAAGVAIGKHVAEDVTQLPPVMIMED